MANYQFAGVVVRIQNRYPFLEKQCAEFRCDDALTPEITLQVTDEELQRENDATGHRFSPGYIESICIYRRLCLEMPGFQGLFLHSSVIRVNGRGIAFLAPSGTGKTTHTALWQQLPDLDVTVINGDKPIIRLADGAPVAYGTPWAGKENLYKNECVTLTDLCFLERCTENSCEPISREEALKAIVHQLILPKDAGNMVRTLELLDRLLRSCRLWKIRCNTDPQAAVIASSTILK